MHEAIINIVCNRLEPILGFNLHCFIIVVRFVLLDVLGTCVYSEALANSILVYL